MRIHNFNLGSIDPTPDKTQTILIINANTPLPRTVSLETFKAISRRIRKVTDLPRKIQVPHAPNSHPCNHAQTPALSGQKDFSYFLVLERNDHSST